MNVFASLSFWVTFGLVLAAGVVIVVRNERARYRQPTQRRGVQPDEQPRLIVTDIGPDGRDNKATHAYHVTTDPQEFADIFVPSGKKE